jgi:hypothetical protein
MRRLLRRLLPLSDGEGPPGEDRAPRPPSLIPPEWPLPYSWVLTNRLAVGPMPAGEAHWKQLEQAGMQSRFSCCYPHEEPLDAARLAAGLDLAQQLLDQGRPVYVHCMAGIERSPLIAVGLTARARNMSLFDALDWVRRCHPAARPIVSHLELLERLLAK